MLRHTAAHHMCHIYHWKYITVSSYIVSGSCSQKSTVQTHRENGHTQKRMRKESMYSI